MADEDTIVEPPKAPDGLAALAKLLAPGLMKYLSNPTPAPGLQPTPEGKLPSVSANPNEAGAINDVTGMLAMAAGPGGAAPRAAMAAPAIARAAPTMERQFIEWLVNKASQQTPKMEAGGAAKTDTVLEAIQQALAIHPGSGLYKPNPNMTTDEVLHMIRGATGGNRVANDAAVGEMPFVAPYQVPRGQVQNGVAPANSSYVLPPPLSLKDRNWQNYGRHMSPDEVLESESVWGGSDRLAAEKGISKSEAFAELANDLWQRMNANRFISPELAKSYMNREMAKSRGIKVVE